MASSAFIAASTAGVEQRLGRALEGFDALALGAEAQVIHDAQGVQEADGPSREALRARERPGRRQLEDQVRRRSARRPRPGRISTTAPPRRAARSRRTCSRLCPYPRPARRAWPQYAPRGRCGRGCTPRLYPRFSCATSIKLLRFGRQRDRMYCMCVSYYLTANLTIAKRGNVKMKVLVINAGSSSLKYQLIDMEGEKLLAKGLCERIGIDGHLKHTPLVGDKPVFNEDIPLPATPRPSPRSSTSSPAPSTASSAPCTRLTPSAHRVVHGGREVREQRPHKRRGHAGHRRLHSLRPAAQPRQHHRHQRLRRCHGQGRAPGRRLRHRLPPDHARQGLYVRPALQLLFRGRRAPLRLPRHLSPLCLRPLRRAHGQAHRGAQAHKLPHGQRLEHLRHRRRQERRHLHGLHPARRPAHGHPRRRHRSGRDAVPHEQVRLGYRRDAEHPQQEVRRPGRPAASAATSATSRPPPRRATSAPSSPSTCSTTPSPRSSAATPPP